MVIEVLHSHHGDKSRKVDTATEGGRQEAAVFINRLMKQGASVFLQRGKKAYRVTKYDPKKDLLTVRVAHDKETTAKGSKSKTTAVAPSAGG